MKITIPTKYRDKLGNKVVATRGIGGCVFLFTEKYWKSSISKLENLQLKHSNNDTRSFIDLFKAGATKMNFGKDGTIEIPEYIKDYAKLKEPKDIVFVEQKDRIEIWGSPVVGHKQDNVNH